MADVADLIRRSLQLIGVVASGEAVNASDQADAFATLNDMLDGWAAEGLNVSTFSATTEEVDLAPGYARAIRFNLAKEFAAEYGHAISAENAAIADESKFIVKRTEHTPGELTADAAVLTSTTTDITTLE